MKFMIALVSLLAVAQAGYLGLGAGLVGSPLAYSSPVYGVGRSYGLLNAGYGAGYLGGLAAPLTFPSGYSSLVNHHAPIVHKTIAPIAAPIAAPLVHKTIAPIAAPVAVAHKTIAPYGLGYGLGLSGVYGSGLYGSGLYGSGLYGSASPLLGGVYGSNLGLYGAGFLGKYY